MEKNINAKDPIRKLRLILFYTTVDKTVAAFNVIINAVATTTN